MIPRSFRGVTGTCVEGRVGGGDSAVVRGDSVEEGALTAF